ncbi:nascent polypeptide-associated complex subunit alpha, muscle-specific form-like isoform X2 [Toxorhynchites rutilus septentrionalis]|uniref:nascent polypeptide-associated complex subunit alpha, muscle-specific form-like isoform X2 n=1 Tax=Toxorhynchites rutilus septentrionalis TaxID=329112 RepID=UPI0024794334|nr:nascent polypeptide-associated complex subunit alpha, muscle-specific form-like isoform X2 [Toxorhynchites rutilus septentrionalis]
MMNLLGARIVFFVLLAAPLVPGQQYTGVKSILPADAKDDGAKSLTTPDHGGGTGGNAHPAISARSIGKFTNDAPAADSKVINLSIKPHQQRDTSGTREARNLGFTPDVSLNSIPGGLNNELSNVDLKDPASTPSEVAKDSYGNPVTPFSALGTTGLDSVGFLTDVSKDGPQSGKSDQFGQLNFKVPSYASGIIQPVLLPPNSPAGFADQLPVSTTAAPTTAFQFVPNAKIPTIDGDDILFAQQPTNGLVPPLFPGEQTTTYKINVGTERSPFFVKDTFGSPPLDQGLAPPSDKSPVNFNQVPQAPSLVPQTPLQVPGQTLPHPQIPQQSPFQPTKAPVQKYTGSFGGAPGFLGSQQNIGTAYTSTPLSSKPVPVPTVPTPTQTQFLPTTKPASTTQTVNKFTGSFGGAPGFLGSQQNLGTAYKPTTSIPQTPQKPLQPTPSFPSQTQPPSAIKPPSPFQPPPAPQAPQPTKAPGGPGFTFGASTQRPGQYSGSFGGSPGLLGNQKQPGTHVKPDGSILPPSSPGVGFTAPAAGPTVPTASSSRPVSSGSTFTGSFGGPPGVLRPYDNVKG